MNYKLIAVPLIIVFSISLRSSAQELTAFPSFLGTCYYEDDVQILKSVLRSRIMSNDLSKTYWVKANQEQTISFVALGVEITSLFGIVAFDNEDAQIVFSIVGLSSAVASIIYSFRSRENRKRSILAYNNGLDGKYSLKIDATRNGIGIVMGF